MKLGMTLVVRNEADIIEANIDYHLAQGVDFVLVTDHGSDDGYFRIVHFTPPGSGCSVVFGKNITAAVPGAAPAAAAVA